MSFPGEGEKVVGEVVEDRELELDSYSLARLTL